MSQERIAVRAVRNPAGRKPGGFLLRLKGLGFLVCGALVAVSLGLPAMADDFPNGCVSCHVVLPDGADKRLAAVLDEIGHLSLKGKVARAPADCIACHEKKVETPFGVLVHQAHFGSPEKNIFLEQFGGDCRHCHAMNGETGEVALKQGDANW